MSGHDPRLDVGRAALIAQLDEARAKVSELAVKLNEAYASIDRQNAEIAHIPWQPPQ